MPVTLDCTSAPFVRCGKKLKLSSDGGDSGSNETIVAPMVGSEGIRVWRKSGVKRSVLC
jgi:hypothetical protein